MEELFDYIRCSSEFLACLVKKATEVLYLFGSSDGLFEGEEVGGELLRNEISNMVISIEDSVNKNKHQGHVPLNEGECKMRCSYPVPELLLFLYVTTGKHDCTETQRHSDKLKFEESGES